MCFSELVKMFICGPLLDSLLLPEESCQVELEFIVIAVHAVFRQGAGTVGCRFPVKVTIDVSAQKIRPCAFLKNVGFRV